MVTNTELSVSLYALSSLVIIEVAFFVLFVIPFAVINKTVNNMEEYIEMYIDIKAGNYSNKSFDIPKCLMEQKRFGRSMYFVGKRLDKKYDRSRK